MNHDCGWAARILLLLLPGLAACGVSRGPIEPSLGGDGIVAQTIAGLGKHGFDCRKSDQGAVCDERVSTRPTIAVVYENVSRQIYFVMPFKVAVPCDSIAPQMSRFNWDVDVAKVSCSDGVVVLSTSVLVPENGLTFEDVGNHLNAWSAATQAALRSSGFIEILRQGIPSDDGDGPPPVASTTL